MKIFSFLFLMLVVISSEAQTAREKLIGQINSGESFENLQDIFEDLKVEFLNLESFTDPYYLTNKGLETGTEDPCSISILIQEKSVGQRKRQRNIIYSFRATEMDLDAKWETNGEIISIPFVDRSVEVEIFKGVESQRKIKTDIIDVVSPDEPSILIDALFEIAEFCETH